jgi:hypothetical protein
MITYILAGCYQLNSQISTPEVLYKGVGKVNSAVCSDFNNDSIPDLIVARKEINAQDKGLLLLCFGYYTAYGQLAFREDTIIQKVYSRILLFDHDYDGDDDIVAESSNAIDCFEIFKNENNVFSLTTDKPQLLRDSCINILEIRDFDHDGLKDIFYKSPNTYPEIVKIAFNKGQGNFTVTPLTNMAGDFLIADINKDGIDDIILENRNDKKLIYLESDQGNFNVVNIDTIFGYDKNIIGLDDYNGDGHIDLGYADSVKDSLYIIYNVKNNSYRTAIIANYWVPDLTFIDVNSDGHKDIYSERSIFINDGQGNFEFLRAIPSSHAQYPISNIIYQYIDTSNHTSLLINNNGSNIRIYQLTGNQSKTYFGIFDSAVFNSLDDIETIDVDNDGILDLVVCSRWGHAVSFIKGLKNKKFAKALTPIAHDEYGAYDVSFADFNRDGIKDVMYSSIWGGNVIVKYGLGNGKFGDKNILAQYQSLVRGSAAGDFENDGYPDIVYSSLEDEIMYFISNKNGIFQNQIVVADHIQFESIVSKDLDKDGDIDLLVAGIEGNESNWLSYINDGIGNFQKGSKNFNSKNYNNLFVDIDNDGVEEFFYIKEIDANTSRFVIEKFQNGTFVFWKEVPDIILNPPFVSFPMIDVNGDKLLDIILKNGYSSTPQILINKGEGNFEYEDNFSDRFGYTLPDFDKLDEYSQDLDGDKDLDLVYVFDGNIYRISDLSGDRAIQGYAYWDRNDNAVLDSMDLNLIGVKIQALNQNDEKLTSFSDKQGIYSLATDTAQYFINVTPPTDCWQAILSDTTVIVPNEGIYDLNFGFRLVGDAANNVASSLTRSLTRCDRDTRYYYHLRNNGCIPIYGELTIDIDAKINNIKWVSFPNYILNGNQLIIKNILIHPGSTFEFDFVVTIPPPAFIGQKTFDTFTFKYDNTDGSLLNYEYIDNQESVIKCSYDPNDKLAFPDRRPQFGKQYILDEEITYTIRFQNTGNDTAFSVLLVDTLSELLDLSTFRPVHSSHRYELTLDETKRILKVSYPNILLPDSTTNLIGSIGFFSFSIKPIKNLAEFTDISNKASIFFDSNVAVITEPVDITFVSDLGLVSTLDPLIKPFNIFPNPATHLINAEIFNRIDEVDIISELGQNIKLKCKPGGTLDISILKPGFYILSVVDNRNRFYSKFVKL